MAALWLPSDDRHALALREPNLLVPGRQALGQLVPNDRHPLFSALEGYFLPQGLYENGAANTTKGVLGIGRNTALANNIGPAAPTLKPVSHLSTYSVVVLWTGDLTSALFGSALYCERPNANQIMKLQARGNTTNQITFVVRNSSGTGLINQATFCNIDTARTIKAGAFVKVSDTERWLYSDIASAENNTSSSGTYLHNRGQLLADQVDTSSNNNNAYAALVFTFNRAISRLEFDDLRADPWGLFKPANDTPYLISVPTGGAITGTGSVASQSSAIAGTAEREITGTSALESQSSTIAGTGAIGGAITGTASLGAQSSIIEGTGTRVITSAAELVSQASVIAGAAERAITGTSVIEAQSSSISGTGLVTEAGVVSGTGALDSQSSTISGTGILARTGTGTIATGVASIDAAGIITRVGTGTLAAQASSISGTGTASTPLTITGTGSLVCGVSSISGSQQTPVWTTIARVETVWTEI